LKEPLTFHVASPWFAQTVNGPISIAKVRLWPELEPNNELVLLTRCAFSMSVETGLDYFEARYYASTQGRSTSVDPLMASGRPASPQAWNRYTYALDNPLRFTDPSGMAPGDFYNEEGKRLGTDGINDQKSAS